MRWQVPVAALGRSLPAALVAIGLLLATAPLTARAQHEIAAELVASGLTRPLFVAAPEEDGRLFIVERDGTIRILLGGSVLLDPFLDITPLVSTAGERGLLGLAFAPDYPRSGVFFVYYTDLAGDSVIARFQASDHPDVADPASQEILLVIDQPFANHNGGTIAFGADGMLYFAPGDGGLFNDPAEVSQNPQSLLGKMLRFDASAGPDHPLAIPLDNPFVGDPLVRDEIWSFGLRNPYRWSFDRETGDLWIADVGQSRIEEINFEPADDPGGRNYGWDVMEGDLCNATDPAPSPPCNDPSLTLPVFQYGHAFGLCSVTGGFVYRGPIPSLQGKYVFGDFCAGAIFSYDLASDELSNISADLAIPGTSFALVGFGEDGAGELYVVLQTGSVYRIRSPEPACSDGFDNDGDGRADADDPACADPLQDTELPRNDLHVEVRPDRIQPARRGLVFALVLGNEGVDLARADPATLAFGPAGAPPASRYAPFLRDLNRDGFGDWVVPFRVRDTGLAAGDDEACLEVEIARVPFAGCDAVKIKKPRRRRWH